MLQQNVDAASRLYDLMVEFDVSFPRVGPPDLVWICNQATLSVAFAYRLLTLDQPQDPVWWRVACSRGMGLQLFGDSRVCDASVDRWADASYYCFIDDDARQLACLACPTLDGSPVAQVREDFVARREPVPVPHLPTTVVPKVSPPRLIAGWTAVLREIMNAFTNAPLSSPTLAAAYCVAETAVHLEMIVAGGSRPGTNELLLRTLRRFLDDVYVLAGGTPVKRPPGGGVGCAVVEEVPAGTVSYCCVERDTMLECPCVGCVFKDAAAPPRLDELLRLPVTALPNAALAGCD